MCVNYRSVSDHMQTIDAGLVEDVVAEEGQLLRGIVLEEMPQVAKSLFFTRKNLDLWIY